jgi:hypothetical protein
VQLARDTNSPYGLFLSLALAVRAFSESGELARARELATEFDVRAMQERRLVPPWASVHLAWAAGAVGSSIRLDHVVASQVRQTTWTAATRAILREEFAEAAQLFARMGARPHEAFARYRAAGRLVAEGHHAEAREWLRAAIEFWRSVGATRYLLQAEALLGDASEIPA